MQVRAIHPNKYNSLISKFYTEIQQMKLTSRGYQFMNKPRGEKTISCTPLMSANTTQCFSSKRKSQMREESDLITNSFCILQIIFPWAF
jgi:hypothetical protein